MTCPSFVPAFRRILPLLRCFRSHNQQPPTHPLLRCAVLYYVASMSTSRSTFGPMKHVSISRLLEQSLARWYLIRPDPTVIESLLIVSLVPTRSGTTIRQDLAGLCSHDSLGAGGIAQVMARQIDLEHSVKIIPTEVGGLGGIERDDWPTMNKLCLVSIGV